MTDDTSPILQAKYPSDQKIFFFQYCLERNISLKILIFTNYYYIILLVKTAVTNLMMTVLEP